MEDIKFEFEGISYLIKFVEVFTDFGSYFRGSLYNLTEPKYEEYRKYLFFGPIVKKEVPILYNSIHTTFVGGRRGYIKEDVIKVFTDDIVKLKKMVIIS